MLEALADVALNELELALELELLVVHPRLILAMFADVAMVMGIDL